MKSYTCWGYKNGKPWKMIYVSANSKDEAQSLAWKKFKDMGLSPDSINISL